MRARGVKVGFLGITDVERVSSSDGKVLALLFSDDPKDALSDLLIPTEEIFGRFSAFDLVNDKTGEIYIEAGDEVAAENDDQAAERGERRGLPAPGDPGARRGERLQLRRCPGRVGTPALPRGLNAQAAAQQDLCRLPAQWPRRDGGRSLLDARATAGAGAEMRRALGTAVFWGMLGVTGFGLLLTPVFYVALRKLVHRPLVSHATPIAVA